MIYEADEFYGDLHHLVQPVVGMLRLDDENGKKYADYMQERLALALDLADLAFGQGKTARPIELDKLRDMRARHGCGYFKNEVEDAKAEIQERWDKYRLTHP